MAIDLKLIDKLLADYKKPEGPRAENHRAGIQARYIAEVRHRDR